MELRRSVNDDEEPEPESPPPVIWLLFVERGVTRYTRHTFDEKDVWFYHEKNDLLSDIKKETADAAIESNGYYFRWKASCVPDLTAEIERELTDVG